MVGGGIRETKYCKLLSFPYNAFGIQFYFWGNEPFRRLWPPGTLGTITVVKTHCVNRSRQWMHALTLTGRYFQSFQTLWYRNCKKHKEPDAAMHPQLTTVFHAPTTEGPANKTMTRWSIQWNSKAMPSGWPMDAGFPRLLLYNYLRTGCGVDDDGLKQSLHAELSIISQLSDLLNLLAFGRQFRESSWSFGADTRPTAMAVEWVQRCGVWYMRGEIHSVCGKYIELTVVREIIDTVWWAWTWQGLDSIVARWHRSSLRHTRSALSHQEDYIVSREPFNEEDASSSIVPGLVDKMTKIWSAKMVSALSRSLRK